MIAGDLFEDDICQEDYFTRLLWIGMIASAADDQGRIIDNPAILRAKIFPLDENVTDKQINESLTKIGKSIFRYSSGGKKLIQIIKWWVYQTPSWAAASKFNPPDGWVDRVKVHTVGNKIHMLNWDNVGGFVDSKLCSNVDSAIDDVKSDGDVKSEDIPAIAEVEEKMRTPEEVKAMTLQAIATGQQKHADSVYDKALKRQYTSAEVNWCQEFTKCTGLHPEPSQVLDWCKSAKINIGAGITADKIHDVLEYMRKKEVDFLRPGSILLYGQKYLAEKIQPSSHTPNIAKPRE
jgi:hypothetical protein